jgi:hypothetical protein
VYFFDRIDPFTGAVSKHLGCFLPVFRAAVANTPFGFQQATAKRVVCKSGFLRRRVGIFAGNVATDLPPIVIKQAVCNYAYIISPGMFLSVAVYLLRAMKAIIGAC